MPLLTEALASNLARLLEEKGISQTDLAKALNTTFQTINAYVNGRGGISTDMIKKFAEFLHVEETDLVRVEPSGRMSDQDILARIAKAFECLRAEERKNPRLLTAAEPTPLEQQKKNQK